MTRWLRRGGILLAAVLCLGGAGWAWQWWTTRPIDPSTLSAQQWSDDLHTLARRLRATHGNIFHRISPSDYQGLVERLDAQLAGRPGNEVPVILEELTAAVGDAHTYVDILDGMHSYPFITYRFGSEWRVTRAVPESKDLLGARLVKIEDSDMPAVDTRLRLILTEGENEWFYRWNEPWFITAEVLHALGLVKNPASATFTFAREDGTTFTRTMAPVDGDPPMVRAYAVPPLFLEHAADAFWFTRLPGTKTVFAVFNRYDDLSDHAKLLFKEVDGDPDMRLVIDLRNNSGGDYLEGHAALIEPILHRPQLNRRDHLFVITGRRTFSAAMNNAAQFHTETRATLVGEPPGEVPNSYQEKKSFVLPNSHLAVSVSGRYYTFLPTKRPGPGSRPRGGSGLGDLPRRNGPGSGVGARPALSLLGPRTRSTCQGGRLSSYH